MNQGKIRTFLAILVVTIWIFGGILYVKINYRGKTIQPITVEFNMDEPNYTYILNDSTFNDGFIVYLDSSVNRPNCWLIRVSGSNYKRQMVIDSVQYRQVRSYLDEYEKGVQEMNAKADSMSQQPEINHHHFNDNPVFNN